MMPFELCPFAVILSAEQTVFASWAGGIPLPAHNDNYNIIFVKKQDLAARSANSMTRAAIDVIQPRRITLTIVLYLVIGLLSFVAAFFMFFTAVSLTIARALFLAVGVTFAFFAGGAVFFAAFRRYRAIRRPKDENAPFGKEDLTLALNGDFLDLLDVPVFILDISGDPVDSLILAANQAACISVAGSTPFLTGSPLRDFYDSPTPWTEFWPPIRDSALQKGSICFDFPVKTGDGTGIGVHATMKAYGHGAQAVLVLSGVFRQDGSGENIYQSYFSAVGDGIALLDGGEKVLYANERMAGLLGTAQGDIPSRDVRDAIKSARRFSPGLTQAELPCPTSTDAGISRDSRAAVNIFSRARFNRGQALVHLPAQKGHPDKAFMPSLESAFRHFFQSLPIAAVVQGADGKIETANLAFSKLFGYGNSELIGQDLDSLITQHDDLLYRDAAALTREAPGRFGLLSRNVIRLRKDGSELHLLLLTTCLSAIDPEPPYLCVYLDLTTQWQAQTQMLRREGFFREFMRMSRCGFAFASPGGTILMANEMFEKTFRGRLRVQDNIFDCSSWLGAGFPRHGGDRILSMDMEGESVVLNLRSERIEKDGATGLEGWSIVVLDITERERNRQELEEKNAYLEYLFRASPCAIVITDNDSKVTRMNPAFVDLFGYSPAEAIGEKLDSLICLPPEEREDQIPLPDLGQIHGSARGVGIRRTKSGAMICVQICLEPIRFENRQLGVYAVYSTISEWSAAEKACFDTLAKKRLFSSPAQ